MSPRALHAALFALTTTILALLSPIGCAPGGDAPTPPPPAAAQSAPVMDPAPIAIPEVKAARFGYRRKGDAWVGGAPTYEVRATDDAISFVPAHHVNDVARRGAPMTLTAAEIRRGSTRLDGRTSAPTLLGDGSLRTIVAVGVTEQLRNDAQSAEQSWTFDAKPGGAGDLVVRSKVTGQRFVASNASGLHFSDAASGVGVRYGHATWIDARGTRTPIAVAFQAGAIVIAVPSAVLDESAFPATLDPTIFPEFGVDNPVIGPSTFAEDPHPAVACGTAQCLVVWEEDRPGDNGSQIYGARVTKDGVLLDPAGFRVSTAAYEQRLPSVAFDGTQYFVVWEDQRTGILSSAKRQIFGARVTTAGAVLDPSGIPIVAGAFDAFVPTVAFDGVNFLVAWVDARDTTTANDIFGARVNSAGVVLDTGGFPIAKAALSQYGPAIACDGTNCLVVWTHQSAYGGGTNQIHGGRVSSSGALLDGLAGFPISTAVDDQLSPRLAFNGTEYLVAWTDRRDVSTLSTIDVYASRVTTAGVVRDPTGLPIAASATVLEQAPVVASNGTEFVVVWWQNAGGGMRVSRVDGLGTVLDPGGVAITTKPPISFHGIAFTGTSYFLAGVLYAYDSPREHYSSVYGLRISPTLTTLDVPAIPVGATASRQERPAVAFDGTNFFVVWSDYRAGEWDIYGARISNDGVILDPVAIAISTTTGTQLNARVAFNGTNYLVVWEETPIGSTLGAGRRTVAARVSPSGAVLDPSGIPLPSGSAPSVACATASCLVVWTDARSANTDVYGARIGASGTVFEPDGFPIATLRKEQTRPVVAFDGTNYAVMWADSMTSRNWGARVAADGVVLDPAGIDLGSHGYGSELALTWAGTQYMLVTTTTGNVSAARFDTTLLYLGTRVAVTTGGDQKVRPALAFDGVNTLVAYEREDLSYSTGVFARRVSQTATLPDTAAYAIAPSIRTWQPAVASNGRQRSLVVYSRWVGGPDLDAFRVRARIVDETFGLPCTADSQCGTGHCVDEVCCDTTCGGGDKSDCMACSTTWGATTNGTCGPMLAGITCRAAAGTCDVAEKCDGTGLSCPADAFAPTTKVCRPSSGACDAAEACSGTSGICPADVVAAPGTVCRASAGACDPAEACDGSSAACPSDAKSAPGTVCRPSAGACDVAETCSGSAECPPNTFAPAITVCRAAAGPCDVAETCSGSSEECPSDGLATGGVVCRPAAGDCDVAETCTGTGAACPDDLLRSSSTVCRAAAGPCDVDETCTGATASCPTDGFAPATTVCHAAIDACDRAVLCSGSAATCATGGKLPDCCLTDAECDDGDPCTTDTCAANRCAHAPNGSCDAGTADAGGDGGADETGFDAGDGGATADTSADGAPTDTSLADTGATDAGAADTAAAETAAVDTGAIDTGLTDTGVADTGLADTSASDTGLADTGLADTGLADTGAVDTGAADTGAADTGVTDIGGTDTGVEDTGAADTAADSGEAASDASGDASEGDAALPTPEDSGGGCGCRVTGSANEAPTTTLLLAMSAWLAVRRRASRDRSAAR